MPEKFRSRKFIMSLAAAVVGLIVVFVPEKADTVESLVQQIAGLVVMLGSIMGWVVTEGSVDKEKERTKQREVEMQAFKERTKQGGHASTATLGVLALAGVLALSGCSLFGGKAKSLEEMEPEQAYFVQLGTFNDVVATALKAKQAGLIDQPTYDNVVYPLIQQADEYLNDAKEARDEGRAPDFREASRALESVLDRLILQTRPLEDQLNELGRLEDALDDPNGEVRLPDRQPRPQDVGPPQHQERRAA
jgi:hypothetical protein